MWEDCILGVNITKLARHDAISFYTYFWSRYRAATTSRRTKKFTYALTYNWKMTRGVFRDLENNALQNWAPDVSKVTLSPCTTNTLKHSFIVWHHHFSNIYFHIHNLKMSTDFFYVLMTPMRKTSSAELLCVLFGKQSQEFTSVKLSVIWYFVFWRRRGHYIFGPLK